MFSKTTSSAHARGEETQHTLCSPSVFVPELPPSAFLPSNIFIKSDACSALRISSVRQFPATVGQDDSLPSVAFA